MKFTDYLNESYTKNELNEGQEIDWNYDDGRLLRALNHKSKLRKDDYSFSEKNGTLFVTSKAKYGISFEIDSLGNIKFSNANHWLKDFKFGSILSARGSDFDEHDVYKEYGNALSQFYYTLSNIERLIRSRHGLE